MKRLINICLYILLPILLIGTLAVWYVSTSIKPDQVTHLIGSTVKTATGRDLKIAGPVHLKFFPSIGVVAERVSLSNAPWAAHSEMLSVKRMALDIELLPLLKGDVVFSAIRLAGVDAVLQTNKAGDSNWNFDSPVTSSINSKPTPQPTSSSQSSAPMDPIHIKHIDVTDANVQYLAYGSKPKLLQATKLSIAGSSHSTNIAAQIQYEKYPVGIKAKTGNLRDILNQWDVRPVKMPIQLTLSVNDKVVEVSGEVDKKPNIEPSFHLRIQSKSFEFAPLAGSAALAASSSPNKTATEVAPVQGRFFFSEDVLPFDTLPQAKGKLTIDINELGISGYVPVTGLKGDFVFDGPKISVSDLSFGIGNKGSVVIQANLSGVQNSNPTLTIKGMAKGFTLEQLMEMTSSNAKVKGGEAEVAFNLRSSGTSLHQLASRADGVVQIAIAEGVLDASFVNAGGDLLITVINAVNPMRKQSDQTTLECAVAYLPLNNGQVVLNNTIGVVTDRLNMTMSGSVDLKTESLNIKIDPKDKSGLTTGVNLGGLVQLQGTLLKPHVGLNKEGVVNSAVSIGLGILTGGASVLAENAKSIATKNSIHPCKTALHSWSDIYPGTKH